MWTVLAETITAPAITDLAGVGSAGLMGAMWLWERRNSRSREQQIDEAHQRIMGDRVQLEQVVTVITPRHWRGCVPCWRGGESWVG